MRSVWKGHIRFSLVTIPIQVFSAIDTKSDISFNQLHAKDNGRISYQRVCRTCDEVIDYKDIVKGYEYADDQYVVLTKDELNSIKLKSTKAIDIEAFVDIGEVHPSRFEAVYYVGPSSEVAKQTFSLFIQALQRSNKSGIGRIILRDKEDLVLLRAEGNGLIMYKLRYPEEVRDINAVPDLEMTEVDEDQLKLAETLISSLAKPFADVDFEDRYKEALIDLVQEKIDGKEVVSVGEEEDDTPVVDIMDALKASIEAAKKLKKGA